ncbi:MAG: MlaC/ttg2D family ABC transporter substrate-binding protein [Fluviibacter sp.]|jgi:phospholipid transport system substrate-binding protein
MKLLQLRKLFLLVGLFIASVAQAELMPPDQLVKQITQETYMYVNQDTSLQKGDISKLIDWAEKSILKDFDFNRMTRLAVGKDWRQATPEQQKQLVYEFRKLLIRTFANAFIGIKKEQTIEYKPFKLNPDDQSVVVKTLILKPGAKPIDVNFSLEKMADSWKVYDVTMAGISLITNYRDAFAQEIHTNGVDGLIKMLAEKNKQLEQKSKAS